MISIKRRVKRKLGKYDSNYWNVKHFLQYSAKALLLFHICIKKYAHRACRVPRAASTWTAKCAGTVERCPGRDRRSSWRRIPPPNRRNEPPWESRGSPGRRSPVPSRTVLGRSIVGWWCYRVFAWWCSPRRRSWGAGASPNRPTRIPSGRDRGIDRLHLSCFSEKKFFSKDEEKAREI